MIAAITTRIDSFENQQRSYVNTTYLKWLWKQGFSVITIQDGSSIDQIAQIADLLILPGGYDMDPSLCALPYHDDYTKYNKTVDMIDLLALKAFHKRNKPILGICRGMQVMNIYFKGTLYDNVNNHQDTTHTLILSKKGILYPLRKKLKVVNSYHHQAIKDISPLLKVEAISSDGIIEAFSFNDHIIGVQWHPEKMENDPILPYFLTYLKHTSLKNKTS